MIGSVLAQLTGGYVLQLFSWREAFIYVGAPGVIFGLLILTTVKEAPRGYSDPPGTPIKEQPSVKEAFACLAVVPLRKLPASNRDCVLDYRGCA